MVADGEKLSSANICKMVLFSIHEFSICTDFHLLKLEGCGVVLGAHWLRTLGRILWNFLNLCMEFDWQGKTTN